MDTDLQEDLKEGSDVEDNDSEDDNNVADDNLLVAGYDGVHH